MTALQTELVRMTWQRVQPIRSAAAALFYQRLFELAPEVRALFKRDIPSQGAMLMATLDAVVGSIDRLNEVLPVAEQLARRHVGYGVQPQHYDTVGQALLWTLERGLGDDFTPAARQAWAETYASLAEAMKRAAYPAPTQAHATEACDGAR